MSRLLNGKEVCESIKVKLKSEIDNFDSKPGLAVILVGDNPASKAYVGMKKRTCEELGMLSVEYHLDPSEGQDRLVEVIKECNDRKDVHGILLQLPLPKDFDEDKMLQLISPEKDVDGFHPVNVGKLLIGLDTFRSCTPYGVMKMMDYYDIDPSGKHVVVMGRSNIVGKPIAAMLVQKAKGANATVTICHSRTQNLEAMTKQADILIVAMGIPEFVKPEMVKEGAIVIDVGINRVDTTENEKGYKLVGDVDFAAVKEKTAAITPVPGGVGPMTIAMLMTNTVQAYKQLTM
ncbi:bifunctional methylenetetrahydrofolate dehydrogenase/methenyltetrahydrofolate cyclohydrolase FolD [Candidatus Marinamargulisbacteria bacterium SCGC AG-439-L15]|nr:bifunctional methylenetetrahydrofolate dehydrogenase/methenyltetrahydrofolate cyclohydrolase FolD [Candidatus Marinamargulisbacteria bacterium SCGC AG-439-L15]